MVCAASRLHGRYGYQVLLSCVIGLLPLVDAAIAADASGPDAPVIGITTPYQQATLAAIQPGRIQDILIEEGCWVRAGDLVIQLDDRVQRAKTAISAAQAESTHEIELALARWEGAKKELARLKFLRGDNHASTKELDDATTVEAVARIEYEIAKFEHTQARLVHYREQQVLEEYRIMAPFDGYAHEHLKHPGETVDEREGIVTLMRLDPIKVVIDCPLTLAPALAVGDRVTVVPSDDQWHPRPGKITLVHRVADGASQTFRVKVVVDNPDGHWLSGMKVAVFFSPFAEPVDAASGGETGCPYRAALVPEGPPDVAADPTVADKMPQ